MNKLSLAALLVLTATTPVLADTVYLFDGSSYRGIITKQDENSVNMKTSNGEMSFQKGRVARISFDDNEKIEADEEAPRVTRRPRRRRAYVEHKDASLACCLSCIIPGSGQAYNGDWGSGTLCCGTSIVSALTYLGLASSNSPMSPSYDPSLGPTIVGVFAFNVGFHLYSAIDAYNKANEINHRYDDEANLAGVMIAEGIR